MQISLSARLAYKLNLDGFLSNIGTFCSDEDISYLAGWLGDATITNSDGKTSMGDDDYCADLDAENIYRLIIQNQNVIEATNIYYTELFLSATRAGIFLRHINYDTIQNKVFSQLNLKNETDSMNKIKDEYPDTYNFLCSIKDGLAHISQY